MLFISLQSPKIPDVRVDGYELRLDHFPRIDLNEIADFCAKLAKPVIFTLRAQTQGGNFAGSEPSRLQILERLLTLKPDFVDCEYNIDPVFLKQIQYSRILLSYHHFQETPSDLDQLLSSLLSPYAYAYKIATLANTSNDALRMLLFIKRHAKQRVSGICMGEKGILTRILGPVVGTHIDYASPTIEEQVAPGQITAEELISRYHYRTLNSSTSLFGLIGNPVDQSYGHIIHNYIMRKKRWNAVYIKTCVSKEDLATFVQLAQELGFAGLSVTAPLKEAIIPYLTEIDPHAQAIGAVNTLLFDGTKIKGYNTDGKGAIQALLEKTPLLGKRIALLGAGGTARAIAYEALQQGAQVTLYNRNPDKANLLATQLGTESQALPLLTDDYDIIINATSSSCPVDPSVIPSKAIVMDVAIHDSPFLIAADNKGCITIKGMDMWHHQAQGQLNHWQFFF